MPYLNIVIPKKKKKKHVNTEIVKTEKLCVTKYRNNRNTDILTLILRILLRVSEHETHYSTYRRGTTLELVAEKNVFKGNGGG